MIKLNGNEIVKKNFPAGEQNINVGEEVNTYNRISFVYENDSELITLALVVNALRQDSLMVDSITYKV